MESALRNDRWTNLPKVCSIDATNHEVFVTLSWKPSEGFPEMLRFRSRFQRGSSRLQYLNSGVYIAGVTPLPIPNRAVKPRRADGTIRVTVWESRSMPDIFFKDPVRKHRVFFVFKNGSPAAGGIKSGRCLIYFEVPRVKNTGHFC